jgi:peptide/nickel transport system ATP-binding protein
MACATLLILRSADVLLEVKNWHVHFATLAGNIHAVRGVDLSLKPRECLAIVGESGSGKSQLFQSVFGLHATNGTTSGTVHFDGVVLTRPADVLGKDVGFVFQDPLTSLTPHMTIGAQMRETLMRAGNISHKDANQKCLSLLERCRIHNPAQRLTQYPHELSGGMRQRVMIAQAIANTPKLLVADEPTTALDVSVQAEILSLLNELRREMGLAIVFITHDMRVAARMGDTIAVMQKGQIVEYGPGTQIMSDPQNAYTKELLAAYFSKDDVLESVSAVKVPPSIVAKDVQVTFNVAGGFFKQKKFTAVQAASFDIAPGECLAVIGESGSGKSSLARAVAGLVQRDSGQVTIADTAIDKIHPHHVQTVFQDPFASLNPRQRVGAAARETLDVLSPELTVAVREARVADMFERVSLPQSFMSRYPHELSGGQCQRVGICRALLAQPKLLICDEAISALDATTALRILDLLADIKTREKMAILFITHDLAAAKRLAEKVIVLERGNVIESGWSTDVFRAPAHATTKALMLASGIF